MITPYDWQMPIIDATVDSLAKYNVFVNGSSMGAGKTIMGLAATDKLNRRALAIVPAATVISWRRTAVAMELEHRILDIVTPNSLVRGSTEWASLTKIPLTSRIKPVLPAKVDWKLPKDSMVIWDEPHRSASGETSLGAAAMAYLKAYNIPVLAMSATIADSPLKLKALGFLLGMHKLSDFHPWCLANGCIYDSKNREQRLKGITSLMFPGRTADERKKQIEVMRKIHDAMGPRFVHLSADDIPGFPETFIDIQLVDLKQDKGLMAEADRAMPELLSKFHMNSDVELMKKRARVEFCKARVLAELAISRLEENRSVVIFSNFHLARERIRAFLEKEGVSNISEIHGDQTSFDRQNAVDKFQANINHVALVMLEAGGAGLNLHDELHQRPRTTYLTPGWNAAAVKQALGRVHRVGGTKSEQYFILATDTIEETTAKYLRKKLSCIDAINDGDL